MNMNHTELVFILDRSGSMYGLESDTIGGFNRVLAENKAMDGTANVTTILFDSTSTLLHDRLPIEAVAPMTAKDYAPAGMTAMLDAVGMGISKIEAVQNSLSDVYKAGHVQFVIMTDGMENSSHEYSMQQIRRMITAHREKDGWDFIFLGANIDAEQVADNIGILKDRSVTAVSDHAGVTAQFEAVCCANREVRRGKKAESCDWRESVNADRKRRGI